MQKKSKIFSETYSEITQHKKNGLWLSIILISVVLIGLVFLVVFLGEPVVRSLYVKGEIYDDINLYMDGSYAEFEGGESAYDFFPAYEKVSNCKVYFKYVNPEKKNSIFWKEKGFYDAFCLDVNYSDDFESYEAQKKALFEEYPLAVSGWSGNYEIFYVNTEINSRLIAFNDSEKTIRYIYDVREEYIDNIATRIAYFTRLLGLKW